MIKVLTHTKNCTVEFINYLAFFCIKVMIFCSLCRYWPGFSFFIIPAVLPLFFYVIRLYIHKIPLFFLLHVLPFVFIFFFFGNTLLEKVIVIFFSGIQAVASVTIRISRRSWESRAFFPAAAMGIMMLMYIVDQLKGITIASTIIMQTAILFLFLYFVYYYLEQFINFVIMNERTTSNLPKTHMLASSGIMVGAFAGISAALMRAAADEGVARKISSFIKAIVTIIVRFIYNLFTSKEMEKEHMGIGEAAPEEALREAGAGSNIWIEILNRILSMLGMLITIGLICLGIYILVKLILKAFQYNGLSRIEGGEKKNQDLVERVKKDKRSKTGKKYLHLRMSQEEKIRRIFRKTVEKYLKDRNEDYVNRISKSTTVRELRELLPVTDYESAQELVILYEKARYTQGNCTVEDVKRARYLAARL